jgi:hypothetical protein
MLSHNSIQAHINVASALHDKAEFPITPNASTGLHPPVRHKLRILLCILSSWAVIFLVSCGKPTPQGTTQLVNVYATEAAKPWLAEVYSCSQQASVVVNLSDLGSADIQIRIGEPELLTNPAYRIDGEDILVVTHLESPVQNLNLEEARSLFAGQGDPSLQVWVYAEGEDLQTAFEQAVMAGQPITSLARLAAGPQQMSDVLNAQKNAVGILSRHWWVDNTREVFMAASVPVLAITKTQPAGVVREMLACLQK